MVEIRRYEESRDGGVLEFLPDRTRVHIGSVLMSTLLDRDRFLKLFLPDGLWLAVSDDATVGAILVGPYDDEIVRCVAVYGIKVDEPCRRQGIGSMLMQKADDFAQSAGLDRLFLETKPDNVPALALFRKCGYKIFESKPNNVRLEKYRSQQ
ncbi:MAG TPA: GNAT family N-acetyltransferase [Anaerolineae bacterium]|nr:GNAT family N-acetyltransferase [Anaerolineae bacterium]